MTSSQDARYYSKSRPDSGWSWIIAASCCFINMMMYGMCRLAGQLFVATFQTYNVSRQEASFPYSLSSAIRNFSGPLVGYLGHKYGVRLTTAAGSVLGAAGIAICYAAADVTWIMVFWGIVFGLGFGLGNVLLPVSINQYFVKHRATASGISLSGACIGSFLLPPLVDVLTAKYGLNGTFLILSGLVLNCVPAAMLLRKPEYDIGPKRVGSSNGNQQRPYGTVTSISNTSTERHSGLWKTSHNNPCFDAFPEEEYGHNDVSISSAKDISNEHPNIYPVISDSVATIRIQQVKKTQDHEFFSKEQVDSKNQITLQSHELSPSSDSKNSGILKKAFKLILNPIFVLIVSSIALYGYAFLLYITVIIDFALDIGIEQSKSTYVLMCFSVGDFFGRLGLGWTTDAGYMSMSTFTAMCFLLQGVAAATVVFTSTFWGLMGTVLVFGIFEAGLIVIFPLTIAYYVDHDLQTVAIPSSNVLYGPICLAVAPTIGYFRETIGSYDGLFYMIGGISILCSLAWFYVSAYEYYRRKNKS